MRARTCQADERRELGRRLHLSVMCRQVSVDTYPLWRRCAAITASLVSRALSLLDLRKLVDVLVMDEYPASVRLMCKGASGDHLPCCEFLDQLPTCCDPYARVFD